MLLLLLMMKMLLLWRSQQIVSSANRPSRRMKAIVESRQYHFVDILRHRQCRHFVAVDNWRRNCTRQILKPFLFLFLYFLFCKLKLSTSQVSFRWWDQVNLFKLREKTQFFLIHLLRMSVVGRMSKSECWWCNLYFVFPMTYYTPPPPERDPSYSHSLLSPLCLSLSFTPLSSHFVRQRTRGQLWRDTGGRGGDVGVAGDTRRPSPFPSYRRQRSYHVLRTVAKGAFAGLNSEMFNVLRSFNIRITKLENFFFEERARDKNDDEFVQVSSRPRTRLTRNFLFQTKFREMSNTSEFWAQTSSYAIRIIPRHGYNSQYQQNEKKS